MAGAGWVALRMFECTYFYFRRCHCRSCQSLCSWPVESASRVVSRPSFEHRAGYWEVGVEVEVGSWAIRVQVQAQVHPFSPAGYV